MIIANAELTGRIPAGGIFQKNVGTLLAAGAGLFSGNPNLRTTNDLYMSATGDVARGGPPPISNAPVPAPSNFGSVRFPIAYYDPNLDYGDPMQVIQGSVRG